MKLSPLQLARYQYNPKLPGMLRNGISEICVKNGSATESVADQEQIKALFGSKVYGVDVKSLEQVVQTLLEEKNIEIQQIKIE